MYDVIVAGGGPAGAMTAKECADRGLDTLLLEQRENGPQSICAGGIGAFWLEEAGLDIPSEVINNKINSVRVSLLNPRSHPIDGVTIYKDDVEEYIGRDIPLGYVVNRREFDKWLLEDKAVNAGATVEKGVKVDLMDDKDIGKGEVDGAEVTAQDGEEMKILDSRYAVDARGADNDMANHVCYQEIVDLNWDVDIELVFDPALLPEGYFWLFNYGDDKYKLGAGTTLRNQAQGDINIKTKVVDFKRELGITGEIHRKEGGLVGTGPIKKTSVQNVLLAGDRKNLASSLTGGGIYPALVSGQVAGEVLSNDSPEEYHEALIHKIGGWEDRQDKARDIVTSLDRDEMVRFLDAMRGYKFKTANPVSEFWSLLPYLLKKDPVLFLKLVWRMIF